MDQKLPEAHEATAGCNHLCVCRQGSPDASIFGAGNKALTEEADKGFSNTNKGKISSLDCTILFEVHCTHEQLGGKEAGTVGQVVSAVGEKQRERRLGRQRDPTQQSNNLDGAPKNRSCRATHGSRTSARSDDFVPPEHHLLLLSLTFNRPRK